jgi:tRNA dimethylallyltransferase
MDQTKLIVLCGPTATGKTEVAFEVAKKLQTEIISFDSLQVYQELDIGTAKPPENLRREIPHHLIDEIPPTTTFTAGDFRKRALDIINARGDLKYLVLVGGTGFYLQALLKGMYEIPEVSPKIKSDLKLESKSDGFQKLYKELKTRDPDYAKTIHPNDRYRVLRGLELLRSGDKKISEIKNEFKTQKISNPVIQFGLRRKKEVLKDAIESRTDYMLARGLITETQNLLEKYPGGIRGLESVGYKETVAHLRGSKENLKNEIVKNTLHLAKRQSTWFKRDQSITWLDPDLSGVLALTEAIIDGSR